MITAKLTRESSKYNPRLRWHVEYFNEDGFRFASQYLATEKLARLDIENTIKACSENKYQS